MIANRLTAGDTLNFPVSVPDYPADAGWTLKFRLVPRFATPTQTPITLIATAEGADYRVQASAATTAGWQPGAYGWQSWVEQGGNRHTLEGTQYQGETTVLPDPVSLTQGADTRSRAQKAVDDLQAALAAYNASGNTSALGIAVKAYEIAGRRMEYQDLRDLAAGAMTLLSFWQNQLAREAVRERLAKGLPDPRYAQVRFGR